jgi:hypothetical protein
MPIILAPATPTGQTFLQLVNRARQECGAGGAALTTLQTGLSTESQRFKDWVNEAWRDVQLHQDDWAWMRSAFTFSTSVGVPTYTQLAANVGDLADLKRDSMRAYNSSVGTNDEQILPFMEYNTWRNVYQFGAMRAQSGRPAVMTLAPDKSFAIGPLPDVAYTIVGEYYRAPSDLVNDADNPVAFGLPARYHMLIVYLAMQSYATFYAAPEVMARGETEGNKAMRRLEFDYLPTLISGPPLA